MLLYQIFFFVFIHLTLLIPSYAILKNLPLFSKRPEIMLIFSYVASFVFLGLLSLFGYVFKISPALLAFIGWGYILIGAGIFIRKRLYKDMPRYTFPLLVVLLMSGLSCVYINLSYTSPYEYVPDPVALAEKNYNVLNVKVLNVAKTQANDNYVPYRQAQFIINRSDPSKDSFIDEWGVHFFQRTPLLGAVTGGYYTLLQDKPPIGYLWNSDSSDASHTYLKFQIIAHIMNAVFIIPAFYLLTKIFDRRIAAVTSLFLLCSQFFLYNSVFTWPKSLVAFFVLGMFLLLLERKPQFTILAGFMGGLAYLTHDLAIFYIAACAILLILRRRYRDVFIFGVIPAILAIPWIITSSVIYKKVSTFMLYPFSLHGLPQPGQQKEIIQEFLRTSPLEIISIRFDTLFYLLSPYDLIYSGGGQNILRRIWAAGLFSIPGSIGFGLVIPVILGIWKFIKKWDIWIFIFIPVIFAALIVGWRGSRAIASLHFAQASIVLLSGFGVAFLMGLRQKLWLLLAYIMSAVHLVFVILYSFNFRYVSWLYASQNEFSLLVIFAIVGFGGYLAYRIAAKKAPTWLQLGI